jgi:hypothetical protein
MNKFATALACTTLLMAGSLAANAQDADMSFFVTSVGVGDGANLGGLEGADAHCQSLAEAVGAGGKEWHAYLSTQGDDAVDAGTRIGTGPWFNAQGVQIATSLRTLHTAAFANINKETALTEKAEIVNGRGDDPNRHDMLTGTSKEGFALPAADGDMTCSNWTSNGEGAAMVGHHDLIGNPYPNPNFWNFSHASRGCSQENLQSTGGDGLFYCFAVN